MYVCGLLRAGLISHLKKSPVAIRENRYLHAVGFLCVLAARQLGGEAQRVAIARALANRPHMLLADEPTGNLDPLTSDSVFEVLVDIVKKTGLAALIATHNPDLADRMDRKIVLRDGRLEEMGTLGMSGRIAFKQRFI